MKLIIRYQEELLAADKSRKENRMGIQEICRMTGSLSQSYFIFDANQYKVGRRIYFNIEANKEDEEEEDVEGILRGDDSDSKKNN